MFYDKKVSLDHYRDPDFLEDALRRYRMYLFLKRLHTQTFLVPCYDIDLVSGPFINDVTLLGP